MGEVAVTTSTQSLMHDFVVPVQMANLRERLVAQFAFEIFDILMVSRLHVSLEQIRMLEALLASLAAVFLARSFLHSDLVLLEHVRVRHIYLTVILVVVIVHVVDAGKRDEKFDFLRNRTAHSS